MADNEAIRISGLRRFSSYKGYARNLVYLPLDQLFEPTKTDTVLAIDATYFKQDDNQFASAIIRREIFKCFVAQRASDQVFATGHWGCGIFGGKPGL
eukprot:CAMPEP_0201555518 /NCGR_PEP_ID=MMETSP0173_2-20130828/49573_1 /ASSEMBLY_ACC=CAM_ASM_000268 /TAXON_ID=218659 /ORGANISM="Vexillifera sp., Strain DIVA3 564/2" /LENGTH=96 /DNA_ID=CAMNT_0047967355 /DNA_START=50 /DNA_END=337 /DNA_ORIENTATION=-